jgi:sialate O-acetylesterase
LFVLFVLVHPWLLHADVRLPAIVSDHMVLMKALSVPVWGKADPGEQVTVSLNGTRLSTTAGPDGKWMARLNLSESSAGPFQMTVKGKNEIAISDVVVGAVWLASGQSNMEFPLSGSLGAKAEIAQSENHFLRQFRVAKVVRPQPADDCKGTWVVASPATAGEFTAVGYYFGKHLSQILNQPVGIINASCGGTFSEAWTSLDAMNRVESFKLAEEARQKTRVDYPGRKKAFVTEFAAWLKANRRQDKPCPDPDSFAAEKVVTADWVPLKLPGKISAPGLATNGAIWIRKQIELPAGAISPGQDFKVNLGHLEGFEEVYWNGKKVWETPYEKYPGVGYSSYFPLPKGGIKVGRNTIAVRIYSPGRPSGLSFDPTQFKAGPVTLAGDWLAKAEFTLPPLPASVLATIPQPPARPPEMPAGGLFNGMIHPLIPTALSGVIWYQGESNAGRAYEYRIAFPMLIQDWRDQWQPDLPFYFCQLPSYRPKTPTPGESEWAELRESQSQALKLPNTEQAILIDLGESDDIHPRNKLDVGQRLARIALAKQYGNPLVFHGPTYESMSIERANVRIKFANVDRGLVARPLPATYDVSTKLGQTAPLNRNTPTSDLQGFSICGEDHHWVWADARIDGDTVVVWSSQIAHPIAVRYAWADNPTCNLTNGAGIPASPFRTDDFPALTAKKHFDSGS